MALKELHHPERGRMRVAGLMSGSGSNLVKIIEYGKELERKRNPAYQVVVIFSDNPESNARKIGETHGIPCIIRGIKDYYAIKGKPLKDLETRAEFDKGTACALLRYDVDVAAYAGYMRIATIPLINAFLGVNVHPADLSITLDGKRKYTGDNAVRDAILAGEKQLRATTHIVEKAVDYGKILMISSPLQVELPAGFNPEDKIQVKKVSDKHQNRLKEIGDWVIFPRTLELIARGRFSKDELGNLYFDNKLIPNGLRI